MSFDLFLLDGAFLHYSQEILPPDIDGLEEPFFPFSDSLPEVVLSSLSDLSDDPSLSAPPPPPPLSSSPPSHQMRGLSLNGVVDFGGVKSEGFDSFPGQVDRAALMQRSFSSRSLDRKPGLLFQPHFSSLSVVRTQPGSDAGANCGIGGPIRRSSSTGDLQRLNRTQSSYGSPSPLAHEGPCMEEVKVGRYSAEERKQRIHRYRSKRRQRNFNKTIKYACRKTLADSRPRVRGRFARNDEIGEIPKAATCHREEEDEEGLWIDALQDEEEGMHRTEIFGSSISSPPLHFRYLGF